MPATCIRSFQGITSPLGSGPEAICTRIYNSQPESLKQAAFFSQHFNPTATPATNPALVSVPLRPLGMNDAWEVWTGPKPLQREHIGNIGIVSGTDHCIVHMQQDLDTDADIARLTCEMYQALLDYLRKAHYPHLVRIWNFIPGINDGSGDTETYMRFNIGRAAAFDQRDIPAEAYPAATAVGNAAGTPLTVIILASRCPPLPIENPRQISAYRYPRQYGPRSPSFARATALPERTGARLFISGTASIVGHQSQHGEIERQLSETLDNLDQLLITTLACLPGLRFTEQASWRMYLRNPNDLPVVASAVMGRLGNPNSVIFLQADLCRRELLVEIEGVCDLTSSEPALRS